MPKEWHDYKSVMAIEDDEKREAYQAIVANKKPYFMIYIYADLRKQYRDFVKAADTKAKLMFDKSLAELEATSPDELTEDEKSMLTYYQRGLPVGTGNCVMNRICRIIENEFDGIMRAKKSTIAFDPSMFLSNTPYSAATANQIRFIYEDYLDKTNTFSKLVGADKMSQSDYSDKRIMLINDFNERCSKVCPDRKALCDILVKLCYKKATTKQFLWDMCSDEIVEALLDKNGGVLNYPAADPEGDIVFHGERFSMASVDMRTEED